MNAGDLSLARDTEPAQSRHMRCSFCGRHRDDVEALVSGPSVYICDQCVQRAARIIAESGRSTSG